MYATCDITIEYKYEKVIDLCGNFTIFSYTNGRWQIKYT